MRIVPAVYGHPDAGLLIEELQHDLFTRYGEQDATEVEASEFAPPRGLFLVGYSADNQPVASGGWRVAEDSELQEGDAELKRMYVAPSARGRGFARAMLRELERTAREAGLTRLLLVTGTAQPEAIELYTSSGYAPVDAFGVYRDDYQCRCFGKVL